MRVEGRQVDDRAAVRRPHRRLRAVGGQLAQAEPLTARVHDEQVGPTATRRGEGDLPPVRRPRGTRIGCDIRRQALAETGLDVDAPDVVLGFERNPLSVG